MWKRLDPRPFDFGSDDGESAPYERYLFSLLSRGNRTKAQAAEKLKMKGASPEVIEKLIARFEDGGYLDDRAYALLFVDTHPEWGPLRLWDDLRRRGVEDPFIREALEETNEEERATALAEEWGAMGVKERKILERLLRRGFSFSVSRKVAERTCEGEV